MYHGFARSAGFNYWESAGYTFAGSALWEIFGETTKPSRNDQVASGIGGTFLGEALFRMASLVLEKGDGVPGFWREAIAAGISPPKPRSPTSGVPCSKRSSTRRTRCSANANAAPRSPKSTTPCA